MPIVTKMPTQRSIVERFISHPLSYANSPEHEDGQHEIEREDRQRAGDDGPRGCGRYALGGRSCVVAFEDGDRTDCYAEHEALDDSVDDVVTEVDRRLHVAPERAGVDADQLNAD